MALLNHAKKELSAKIVYYGPGLSGKTTNLEWIHRKLAPEKRGKLISLETKTDRTLFFDFLPVQIGDICGYKTKFNVYTVPGQIFYNETRRVVLKGVDGVVFVADSQKEMANENLENLKNLAENLRSIGKELFSIPLVLQYNKRDLPNVLTVEELNGILNPKDLPFFESIAMKGEGVLPALSRITRMVAGHLKKTLFPSAQLKASQPAAKKPGPTAERRMAPPASRGPRPVQTIRAKTENMMPPPGVNPASAPAMATATNIPAQPRGTGGQPEKTGNTVSSPGPSFSSDNLPSLFVEDPPQPPSPSHSHVASTGGKPQEAPFLQASVEPATMVLREEETMTAGIAVQADAVPIQQIPELETTQYLPEEAEDSVAETVAIEPELTLLEEPPAMDDIIQSSQLEAVPHQSRNPATPKDSSPANTPENVPSMLNISAENLSTSGPKKKMDLLIGNPERKSKNELKIPIALRMEGSKERISFQLSIRVDPQE